MLALIQDKIKALGCTVWELSENTTRGWEFYFIRHRLDQNRVTDVKTIGVTLYRPPEAEPSMPSSRGRYNVTPMVLTSVTRFWSSRWRMK